MRRRRARVYENDAGIYGGRDVASEFFSLGSAMYVPASNGTVPVDGGSDGAC